MITIDDMDTIIQYLDGDPIEHIAPAFTWYATISQKWDSIGDRIREFYNHVYGIYILK